MIFPMSRKWGEKNQGPTGVRSVRRRAQFWIDPDTQWRVIRSFLVLNAVIVTFFYGVDRFFFFRMHALGQSLGLAAEHPYFLFLQEQQDLKFYAFLGAAALISFGLMVFALFFSHRIAGPIFKLRRTLQGLGLGEAFHPISFRKGDFFESLDQDFNVAVRRLLEQPTGTGVRQDPANEKEKKAC
jgi:hypothetical protein